MRTELIYLWINKDTHGCFHREGFNFSPRYSVSYSPETRVLRIETLDTINVFKNSNIANVTAIIGENGTGKTTLLEAWLGTAKEYKITQTSHPVLASKSAFNPSKSRNFATSAGKSAKNSTMRAQIPCCKG